MERGPPSDETQERMRLGQHRRREREAWSKAAMSDFLNPLRAVTRVQASMVELASLQRAGTLSRQNAEITIKLMRRDIANLTQWLDEIERATSA